MACALSICLLSDSLVHSPLVVSLHMVSYQRVQSELPVFLVDELGILESIIQNDCFEKPDFSDLFNYRHKK